MTAGAQSAFRPSVEGVKRAFEAEPCHGHCVGERTLQQERAHQIVCERVHPQLAFDHRRREAAQDIEGEVGLDLPECSPICQRRP